MKKPETSLKDVLGYENAVPLCGHIRSTLQFSPDLPCNIIGATAVFHNICIENKVPDPD